jgi:hypothetical protein
MVISIWSKPRDAATAARSIAIARIRRFRSRRASLAGDSNKARSRVAANTTYYCYMRVLSTRPVAIRLYPREIQNEAGPPFPRPRHEA